MEWINDTATPVSFPTLGLVVDPGESIELDEKDERTHGFLRSVGAMAQQTPEELAIAPAEEPEPGSVTAHIRAHAKKTKRGSGNDGAGSTGGQDGKE